MWQDVFILHILYLSFIYIEYIELLKYVAVCHMSVCPLGFSHGVLII